MLPAIDPAHGWLAHRRQPIIAAVLDDDEDAIADMEVLMPERVQLKRRKGWKMPPNTVSVARPGRWGNPYSVEDHGRAEAIRKYREWLLADVCRQQLKNCAGKISPVSVDLTKLAMRTSC